MGGYKCKVYKVRVLFTLINHEAVTATKTRLFELKIACFGFKMKQIEQANATQQVVLR